MVNKSVNGYIWGVLTGKRHKKAYWYAKNVLYLYLNVVHAVIYISKTILRHTLKIREVVRSNSVCYCKCDTFLA